MGNDRVLRLVLVVLVALGAAFPAAAGGVDEELAAAEAASQGLRYDELLPLVEKVLARPEASGAQRLRAWYLQGSALAAMNRQLEAEKAFRFLLRGEPNWEIPADTPPKIAAVFRKVQVEEQAIRSETARTERERLISQMSVAGGPAAPRRVGGTPMEFRFELKDPQGVVRQMRLSFRRQAGVGAGAAFASVPLSQGTDGGWSGEIPASATESEVNYTMHYFVEALTHDDEALLTLGTAAAPLSVDVERGTVAAPFYATPWFWVISGGAAVAVAAAAGLVAYIAGQPPESDLPITSIP